MSNGRDAHKWEKLELSNGRDAHKWDKIFLGRQRQRECKLTVKSD